MRFRPSPTRVLCLSLGLFAACGDVVKKLPDGGGNGDDGGGNSDTAPIPDTIVHVRAFRGVPDLAANVLVMTDSGDVIFDGLVDGTGSVTATLPSTGWVTARSILVRGNSTIVEMTTIRGVKPGDELFIGPPNRPEDATTVNANRSIAFTRYASTASHTFYVPCGNRFFATTDTATSGTVPIRDECVPQTFSLLGVATLNSQQFFSYVPNQTRGATTAITVPTPWNTMSTLNASFTNVPSGMEYFSLTRTTLLDGVGTLEASVGASNPAPSLALAVPYAPGVGSGARFRVAVGNQTTGERQWVTMRSAAITGTIGFDYSQLNLPRLLSVPAQTVTGASWTQTAGTFAPDVRIVRWTGHFAGNTDITWTIVDNEVTDSITLPTLPPSYAAYDPSKLSSYTTAGDNMVFYVDCDTLTSYDAARPLNVNLANTNLDLKATLGDNYRCRISESAVADPI